MHDPHVVALHYRIEHHNSVDYGNTKPLVREERAFRLEVREKKARFELKIHYGTEDDARELILNRHRVLRSSLMFGPCMTAIWVIT